MLDRFGAPLLQAYVVICTMIALFMGPAFVEGWSESSPEQRHRAPIRLRLLMLVLLSVLWLPILVLLFGGYAFAYLFDGDGKKKGGQLQEKK